MAAPVVAHKGGVRNQQYLCEVDRKQKKHQDGSERFGRRLLRMSWCLLVLVSLFWNVNIANLSAPTSAVPSNEVYPKQSISEVHTSSHRLEFVHIPKTGGYAVELEAARYGVKWGMCHFWKPKKGLGHCHKPPEKGLVATKGENSGIEGSVHFWMLHEPDFCSWWHFPPAYFLHKYANDPMNPYRNATLFAVVRNPYSRVLSHYYYHSVVQEWTPAQRNNPDTLNTALTELLTPVENRIRRPNYHGNLSDSAAYFDRDCHLIPQYHYVHDGKTRVIPIVLRFETLQQDLEKLMREYEMPFAQLPKEDVREVVDRTLTLADVSPENMRLIEQVYQDDFREFGYEIVSSTK